MSHDVRVRLINHGLVAKFGLLYCQSSLGIYVVKIFRGLLILMDFAF